MTKFIYMLLIVLWSHVLHAEVAVIVHPANQTVLSAEIVQRIYLGRDKSFPDGNQAVPVALPESAPNTEAFNNEVLKKSSSQLKAYWSKLVFTGKGTPPKTVVSDEEMMQLIGANPNLIGYVDAASVNSSVKVVLKF